MKKFVQILFSALAGYVIIIFLGAYLTLKCESSDPSANIREYADALWWALNATSIGDSNVYPITGSGRIVGAFLIVLGYGLFTINVATISSFLNHLLNGKLKKKIEDKL